MSLEERLLALSEQERVEAEKIISELTKRKNQRKFFSMYPDEGKYRRELYPKHMEFIAASRQYNQTCFMAANRCVSPWTWVETKDHTMVRAPEAFSNSSLGVRAWHDEREQSAEPAALFVRKLDLAYRVVLDNGQFFDCCRKHQVLTSEGYTSLDQLVSGVSGTRWSYKLEDYQASCVVDGYLCGRPLLEAIGSALRPQHKLFGAHRHSLCWSRRGALERAAGYIHACQQCDLDPMKGDQSQTWDLFSQFLGPATPRDVLPWISTRQVGQRTRAGVGQAPRSNSEAWQHQRTTLSTLDDLTHGVVGTEITWMDALQESARSCLQGALDERSEESLTDHVPELISVFEPYKSPELVGGRTIKAIVPIGYQPIIDTQVPNVNNYKAGGVYHHNCGKTVTGAYATTCHLTGRYPPWWQGRVFNEPVKAWAAGDTAKNVRDILQLEMLGAPSAIGTGMIPGEYILRKTPKAGVPDAVDMIYVKHFDRNGDEDGISTLQLKSYDQGRVAFQGTAQHVVWLDEECPMSIYTESLTRTMTTKGIVYLTFTPLKGITDVVQLFRSNDERT